MEASSEVPIEHETPATVEEGPQPTPLLPTGETERLEFLDILRGFAVLGILVMNIQAFSMPLAAYQNPGNFGDLTGAHFVVWAFGRLFFDQKFMALFSMLFGAGIVLMARRVVARGGTPRRLHYRRMLWLLLFGLLHAFLLWFGDILFSYSLCAMIVFFCWKFSPARQLALGLALLAIPVVLSLATAAAFPGMPEEVKADITLSWHPAPELIQQEVDAMRGGWGEQMPVRSKLAGQVLFMGFLFYSFGRAGGLMLIGMALFQWGILSGLAQRRIYLLMLVGGLFVGLPLVLTGIILDVQNQWTAEVSMFLGIQFNYWGSIPISLAFLGALALLYQGARKDSGSWLRPMLHLFTPAGRMALTCYLSQTLICTTLFYGHGFGLFGHVERLGQLGITVAIWVFLLVFSRLWLHFFRFGPFEWLWRSLTYRRVQPLRRTTA